MPDEEFPGISKGYHGDEETSQQQGGDDIIILHPVGDWVTSDSDTSTLQFWMEQGVFREKTFFIVLRQFRIHQVDTRLMSWQMEGVGVLTPMYLSWFET